MAVTTKISILWICVLFNMAFADILSYIAPGFLAEIMNGTAEGLTITPMLLLVAAIFIEIPIVMIYLSRTLTPRRCRVANLVAVVLTALFIVGGASLKPHYIFFGSFELIALFYIAYLSWNLRDDALVSRQT